jgi:hypothetical protein
MEKVDHLRCRVAAGIVFTVSFRRYSNRPEAFAESEIGDGLSQRVSRKWFAALNHHAPYLNDRLRTLLPPF